MKMDCRDIMARLKSHGDPEAVRGMARYGINPEHAFGISIPVLRGIAKEIGRDRRLAAKLWSSRVHEARILAGMIDDPERVTEQQMERWVRDFNSWDLCDQCCSNLFEKTPFAYRKAVEWSLRKEEYVKRAGFVLMARLAVSDKKAADERFERFFLYIKKGSSDERNYVKKAVNWALRQIGKRNRILNEKAIETALEIRGSGSSAARWIASDALRELRSKALGERLKRKEK
jgi:3-methyladenine DNA glycosylase AlkD